MELVFIALLFAIIAGILNGSFALPIKYLKINDSKLWLYFSFWAFVVIPLISIVIINPHFTRYIATLPDSAIFIPFAAGFLWGIGMVFLSIALKYIGIGISFVINIGIGTAGGTLIPFILFPGAQTNIVFNILIYLGVTLLILAVISAGIAAHQREKFIYKESSNSSKSMSIFAIIITILCGISSAIQGASYAFAISAAKNSIPLEYSHSFISSAIPWLFIFAGGFIPYALYFFIAEYCYKKQNPDSTKQNQLSLKGHLLIIAMAIMLFESVIFYSKASQTLGALGPIVAWPLFMAFIILMSNFWGFKHGEWKNIPRNIGLKMCIAIFLLLVAIVILVIASTYH
ncbi:L-rhamnose/proton symporter RhaT [Fangia hongkongensis]|uniref:L-rhamnose/proton symporter RhaT n=2 Tax=Fangia hongkongensis TaxID=270495 RepID=UPI0003772F77|nr:L-rhamnose/proton symporter RhaT [Fangia hongkongensis]